MISKPLVLLGPAGLGSLAGAFRSLLSGELRSPRLAAFETTTASKLDSGRVLPRVRIDAGSFPGRFLDQLLGKLVYVRGALT
jgi:hypothetical protein